MQRCNASYVYRRLRLIAENGARRSSHIWKRAVILSMIHSLSQKARRARERSIVAFFATSLAQRGIGVFCQFAQVPIALHYLGSEGFGLWVTLMTLNFVVSSSDLGIGFGVQNRIAEALGAGDCDGARKVFVTGLCFLLGMMVVLLAVLISLCLLSDIPRIFRTK